MPALNPLRRYFEENSKRLIHKWTHYFDIYHRHFEKFRGTAAKILEIGVSHGGSLQMWRDYFGPAATITGVDIDPRCRNLEEDGVLIRIGDQADPAFLRRLRAETGVVQVVIDDGGHTMEQQITTFNELYSAVEAGGVYLVEDLHTSYWAPYGGGYRCPTSFIEFSKHHIDQLNAWHSCDPELKVDDFTRATTSMHYYDSVVVFEKHQRQQPISRMTGTLSFPDPEAGALLRQARVG